jgi:L-fucose mutarotase/ribose pyranase (RbsD/FucU family)
MDVPEVSRTDFYARLQNNFSLIYTSPEIKSGDVLRNIEALM